MEAIFWKMFVLFQVSYFSNKASVVVGLAIAQAFGVHAGGAASFIFSMSVPIVWISVFLHWFTERGDQ